MLYILFMENHLRNGKKTKDQKEDREKFYVWPDIDSLKQVCDDPHHRHNGESHADHLNVGNAARELSFFASIVEIMAQYDAKPAPVQGIAYYMTARPNAYITTSKELLNKQLSSVFNCHLSQFPENSQEAASISRQGSTPAVAPG